jgi:hypothetical protein
LLPDTVAADTGHLISSHVLPSYIPPDPFSYWRYFKWTSPLAIFSQYMPFAPRSKRVRQFKDLHQEAFVTMQHAKKLAIGPELHSTVEHALAKWTQAQEKLPRLWTNEEKPRTVSQSRPVPPSPTVDAINLYHRLSDMWEGEFRQLGRPPSMMRAKAALGLPFQAPASDWGDDYSYITLKGSFGGLYGVPISVLKDIMFTFSDLRDSTWTRVHFINCCFTGAQFRFEHFLNCRFTNCTSPPRRNDPVISDDSDDQSE